MRLKTITGQLSNWQVRNYGSVSLRNEKKVSASAPEEAKAATRFSFRAQTSFILGGLEPYRALSLKRGAL